MALWQKVAPWLCAVTVPLLLGGNSVLIKAALKNGMEIPIFLLYKYAFASVALVPLVIINWSTLPPMTWKILFQIITLGIVGPGLDNMFYAGMKVIPATFATCITSLVPALTFLGSWMFRLETVHIQERPSQAKLLGTAIMTTGAFVSGIYGGPVIVVASTSSPRIAAYLEYNWVRGPLFLVTSLLSAVAYNILLDRTIKSYPAPLALAAYICCIGAGINMGYSFIREGTSGLEWLLGLDIRLGAYLYSGLFVSGLNSYIQGRLTKLKGPVFFISFSPLSMIIVMVLGTLILKEDLKLGRLIGALILVLGLGILLWGKSQGSSPDEDQNQEEEEMEASSGHHNVEALEATQEEQILEDEEGLHELELAAVEDEEDHQASEPEENSLEDDESHHTVEVGGSSGGFHIVELFEAAEEVEIVEQMLEDEEGLHELELAAVEDEEDHQASEPEENSLDDDHSHHTVEVGGSSGEFHIVELFEAAEEVEIVEQMLEDEEGLHELELAAVEDEEDHQASEPEENSLDDDHSHHTVEVGGSSGEFHIVELYEAAEEVEIVEQMLEDEEGLHELELAAVEDEEDHQASEPEENSLEDDHSHHTVEVGGSSGEFHIMELFEAAE